MGQENQQEQDRERVVRSAGQRHQLVQNSSINRGRAEASATTGQGNQEGRTGTLAKGKGRALAGANQWHWVG